MGNRLAHWLAAWKALGWATAILVGVGFMLLSLAIGFAVVLWLPRDYFVRTPMASGLRRHRPVLWLSLAVVRNLLGIVVLSLGVVMAMPLVPGPGVFVVLVGLGLLDFPGKRALERRILGQRYVLSSVNRIRMRFGKAPLLAQE